MCVCVGGHLFIQELLFINIKVCEIKQDKTWLSKQQCRDNYTKFFLPHPPNQVQKSNTASCPEQPWEVIKLKEKK